MVLEILMAVNFMFHDTIDLTCPHCGGLVKSHAAMIEYLAEFGLLNFVGLLHIVCQTCNKLFDYQINTLISFSSRIPK